MITNTFVNLQGTSFNYTTDDQQKQKQDLCKGYKICEKNWQRNKSELHFLRGSQNINVVKLKSNFLRGGGTKNFLKL